MKIIFETYHLVKAVPEWVGDSKKIFLKRGRTEARPCFEQSLLDDVGDGTGSDEKTAFADGEAQALLHRDRGVQRDLQRDVVARHHHLGALRSFADPVTSVVRK